MQPLTTVFLGPQGCGKGTQAELLLKYLKEIDPKRDSYYLETGKGVREFAQNDNYSAKLAKKILDEGGLFPEFLSIWIWADMLIKHVTSDNHIILDGTPRKEDEAWVLSSAFKFYKREKPFFIYLNISREEAEKRLLARKRGDDNKDDIKARLDWFDTRVIPAIEYFKKNPNCVFLDIPAEGTVAEVLKRIITAIKLS